MTMSVTDRMEYIEKLFMQVLHFTEGVRDTDEILKYIDQLKESAEYESIVYESVSMSIAIHAIEKDINISEWINFKGMSRSLAHAGHIHIGLGMGLAAAGNYTLSNKLKFQPLLHSLVFDGMGYYDALFRGRSTLKEKIVPSEVTDMQNYYDQGIGRRIWYHCRGNLDKLNSIISSFEQERQPALWKGIGIACGYVGGNIEKGMEELLLLSGKFKIDFGSGVLLAALSRIQSNTIIQDIKLACLMATGCKIDRLVEENIQLTDFESMKDLCDFVKTNFSSVNTF